MGYWFINNESPPPDKHTESPPAQMVNGRRLFRLSGCLDGISPRSFFLRALYISSDIFYPAFLLTSLSLSRLSAGSGWLWLGVWPVLSEPLAGPVWAVCGWWGPGKGFYLQASLYLIWPVKALAVLLQVYKCIVLFFPSSFLTEFNWESPVPSSLFKKTSFPLCFISRDRQCLPADSSAIQSLYCILPPPNMLHSNSFRLPLKIIMLVL